MHKSRLVAFYRGNGRDHRGRALSDIHEFDFYELEFNHDYIQWLFPLPEPSGASASAPLLSSDDIESFISDNALQRALLHSLQLMLQFYGLEIVRRGEAVAIEHAACFGERSSLWLTAGNHNFLRISRMLRSLTLLGLGQYASAFLHCLTAIYARDADTIGQTTMGYWRRAVESRSRENTKP